MNDEAKRATPYELEIHAARIAAIEERKRKLLAEFRAGVGKDIERILRGERR